MFYIEKNFYGFAVAAFLLASPVSHAMGSRPAQVHEFDPAMLGKYSTLVSAGAKNQVDCPAMIEVSKSPLTGGFNGAPYALSLKGVDSAGHSTKDELGFFPYLDVVGPYKSGEGEPYPTSTTETSEFSGDSITDNQSTTAMGISGSQKATLQYDSSTGTLSYEEVVKTAVFFTTEDDTCVYKH
jgi:hypothetical protein